MASESEREEFFEKSYSEIKSKLNEKLLNNPRFDDAFYKELNYFYRKTMSLDFDVVVAADSNSVIITSTNPIENFDDESPVANKAYLETVIYLKDNNMVCDFSQGVLFDRKDLEKSNRNIPINYETKLENFYSTKYFDECGIEYSDNSYNDVYFYDEKINDINIREQVVSTFHKPVFDEYHLATSPIHIIRATVRNTYRKSDSLGIIHSNIGTLTRDGYKDVNCVLFTCHASFPDRLRGDVMFAKARSDKEGKFKFEIMNYYAKDIVEAYNKAKDDFKKGVMESDLKSTNEKAYDRIIESL